jgi:hypothetical protein
MLRSVPRKYDKPRSRGAYFRFSALAPVMTVPVVPMPMAVMPTPVTMVPMMPVPVMAPADFLRLQLIDFGLRDQCGLRGLHSRSHDLHRRGRRQRRGIGNADKRHSARRHSDREFQNRAKFHPGFSLNVMS